MGGIRTKMSNKTFTIVTVTYNAEDLLEQTIKSVIEQDYKNIEYIIIDGKSKDKTLDIIKKYEKYISYWISEEDSGIYDAMNKAIDKATGKYINFLNAGDTFAKNDVLSKVSKELSNEVDYVYGGVNNVDENGYFQYVEPLEMCNIWNSLPFSHQSLFVKTKYMKIYKFNTDYKICADLDFVFKLYIKDYMYKILKFPIANFLLGGFHSQNIPRFYLESMYISSNYTSSSCKIYQRDACSHFVLGYFKHNPQNKAIYNYFNVLLDYVSQINLNYKNILLYGNSSLCKIIEKFLTIDYKIVDIATEKDSGKFINPKNINNYQYEAVFITLLGREDDVKKYLLKLNVCESKIKHLEILGNPKKEL